MRAVKGGDASMIGPAPYRRPVPRSISLSSNPTKRTRSGRSRDKARQTMTQSQKNNDHGHELVWFRITVVVISLGLCAGKALIWLHL